MEVIVNLKMVISGYSVSNIVVDLLTKRSINELMPVQKKALSNGLLDSKNLLVCSPTGSGKTLIAEIAMIESLLKNKHTNKAIYIVPLKALAQEKYKSFQKDFSKYFNIAVMTGDNEETQRELNLIAKSDIIIITSEKLDSILRHNYTWVENVSCLIVDEVHLMNDLRRGPVLEIVITLMRQLNQNMQVIALSATIGNSQELSEWLEANLIYDEYRPVELKKGVIFEGKIDFVN